MAQDYDDSEWESGDHEADVNDSKTIGDNMIRRMSQSRQEYFRSQHVSSKYEPRWEKNIERHPDKRPSDNLYEIVDDKKTGGERIVMEVHGLGAVVFKKFKHPSSGVVMWKMSSLTDEEIHFE